jgi:hypothetical protein
MVKERSEYLEKNARTAEARTTSGPDNQRQERRNESYDPITIMN